jgi:hypothetical protein
MSARLALAVAALVAGCQFDGGLGDGLLCPTGECPAGQVCVHGRCSAMGGETFDAAAPADGGVNRRDAGGGPDAGLGPNLVINPGMEDGTDPWTPFNSVLSISSAEHSGEVSLQVCGSTEGDFTVYEDVIKSPSPIVVGTAYRASVWVRATDMGPAPASMKLTIRESGGGLERTDHDGPAVLGLGDTWVQLHASGTIQESDRENLILIAWGLDAPESGCFVADDAVLRQE